MTAPSTLGTGPCTHLVHGSKEAGAGTGIPLDVPWRELPEGAREVVLRGEGSFEGVYGFFAQMERKKYKLHVRVMLSNITAMRSAPSAADQRRAPRPAPCASME